VATRVGGVAELVEEGASGFLAPPANPEALSRSMRQLMSLPAEERRRMGLRGRDRMAAHYGLEAMAERWLALYHELLTEKGFNLMADSTGDGAQQMRSRPVLSTVDRSVE
jgi:glycosyltransferase involved in cell wall biosynthesis